MLALLLSLLIPPVIGFLFVSLLWPVGRLLKTHLLMKVCLAVGAGYGITSCLFFLWLVIYGQADRKYILVEIVVLLGLFAALFFKSRKRDSPSPPEADLAEGERWKYERLFTIAFYAALIATLLAVVLAILREPHGGWDAWAIYELRARMIFRAGINWQDGLSSLIYWTNPNYPLLLPASTARIWVYCGREVVFAQAILSALFTFATVGLLLSALARLRSRAQGFLGAIVLLGFTTFITYGSTAYADLPIMFFCLATFVLFALQHESKVENYNYLILAGVIMGLAAWTKNEGALFVLSGIVAHLVVVVRAKGMRAYLRQLRFILFGLLPILAILIYFKTQLSPPNELVTAMSSQSMINKLLDYHRYFYIAREFLRQIFYEMGYGVGLAYLLVIYLVCVGATLKHKVSIKQLSLMLCLVLAGYFWVYLTSPYELAYHMRFSLDRLLLQQWPGFVFLYFLTALTPEETLREKETRYT